MGQFVETIDGISQACKYLDFPVVSGNVSFYNETQKKSINPTPVIGGVGLIKNLKRIMTKNLKENGSSLLVVGRTLGHLYQSELLREVLNIKEGPPPEVNLFNEKNNGLIISKLISENLLNSVHDISSGGILVSLAEMCISSKIGAKINVPVDNVNEFEYFFGEDQSRYLIEVNEKNKKKVINILEKNTIYYDIIGITQKDTLYLNKDNNINLSLLNDNISFWFRNYFKEN